MQHHGGGNCHDGPNVSLGNVTAMVSTDTGESDDFIKVGKGCGRTRRTSKGADMKSGIRYDEKLVVYDIFLVFRMLSIGINLGHNRSYLLSMW